MKKGVSILFAILAVMCSCRKDALKSSGSYVTGDAYQLSRVTMYTRNGVIIDTAFIRNFLQRSLSSAHLFHFSESAESVSSRGQVHFFPDHTVTLSDQYNILRVKITEESADKIVLSDIDSSQVLVPFPLNPCEKLLNKARSYPLVIVSSATGVKFKRHYPIIVRNGNLILPYLMCQVSYKGICYQLSGNVLDILNPDLASSLQDGDTVVAQTKELPLIKE